MPGGRTRTKPTWPMRQAVRLRLSMAIVTAFGQRLSSRMSQVGTNGALEQRAKLERDAA